MVSLLVLLLLPGLLAVQVCLYIQNGAIDISINSSSTIPVKIVEELSGYVKCAKAGSPCLFQCNNTLLFNGSYNCLEVTVKTTNDIDEYTINENTTCILTSCNNTVILSLIKSLDAVSSNQKEMMRLIYFRDSCSQLFTSNYDIRRSFIDVERKIIHNIMATPPLESEASRIYSLKVLSLNVVKISDADLSSTGTNSRIQVKVPELLPQNSSFVPDTLLPVNALRSLPKEKRIIGLVSYMRHNQFQFGQEDISSMVMRIELLAEPLHDLKPPIEMTFRVVRDTVMDNHSWFQCHYFDERVYQWKPDGCETTIAQNSQMDIVCNCNHTTPFAVLLVREPIAAVHWKILSYISYIGCGLSAFFTALSIVIYVFSRNHGRDHSISIHVSLSGALFLLNTTFLLTEWGAKLGSDWVCVFLAALMHYSLLCCFTWMAIEALHLYLLLIKVFNTYYKHYLIKLSLAGWGVPSVIVAVSLGLKDFKQFYGITQLTMSDTNSTNAICWITDDSFFYSLNLVYFTLIFIFNSGILMAVASSICKMKQVFRSNSRLGAEAKGETWRDAGRFSESCRSGLTVLGLTCLMGTTWGLAFLGSGYINYPILYLFCILNSMQGFFIFLWICLSSKKLRKKHMEDRMSSNPVKTASKSD